MEIKYLFFDYGGTIDCDGLSWRERFYKLYRDENIDISYEEFSKAFFDSDDNLFIRHNIKDAGFVETIYFQVNDVFKYLKISDDKKVSKIAERFISDSIKQINKNIEVFEILKSRGIKLGIISNFYGNLTKVLESLNIRKYFEVVADSQALGYTKPDIRIFEWAIEKMKAEKEKTAMVGDALHRDVKGACDTGIYHFYLTRRYEAINKCCDKLIIINSLKEILNFF